ncbi:MlaE family ABC transporter permease [Litchfieldella rifensis]|uniref:MlaE family ABC transporter permease n=1 Tax=Litchfieldella rifensis TaxID=762643 RepID=A0ABV7LJU8_9GAMM
MDDAPLPRLEVDRSQLHPVGDWTTLKLASVADEVLSLSGRGPWQLDARSLGRLDSNGARLLAMLSDGQVPRHLAPQWQPLFELVVASLEASRSQALPRESWLARLGRHAVTSLSQLDHLLATLGQLTLAGLRVFASPARLRLRETLNVLTASGAMAVPIIALLAFLLGAVLAYQGGIQLRNYGVNVFIVELVTITLFREFGPLITAIIVAGRSGAAFTAELATMRGNREIDALITLGMSPVERLMLPKLLGLVLAMPLLTVLANVSGLLGGMVVADTLLDVGFETFYTRIPENVAPHHFWIGIGKSLVFAVVIALVGCSEGMRARGDAESIGRNTTASVVQSIFWVIVLDALFSVVFNLMGW